jgi:hypothetical protein
MNWKKHQTLNLAILLAVVAAFVTESVSGEVPLDGYDILQVGMRVLAATVAWAFLETCWELGNAYRKRLCTFMVALRRFCRDYWSKTAAV